jgi:hemerythrin-like domain-containing protein
MLQEHEQGRALIRALEGLSRGEGPFSEAEREEVRQNARNYVYLLRDHIVKEDQVLYPMAQQMLPPEAMDALGERFETFEREQMGEGVHERMHGLADTLTGKG